MNEDRRIKNSISLPAPISPIATETSRLGSTNNTLSVAISNAIVVQRLIPNNRVRKRPRFQKTEKTENGKSTSKWISFSTFTPKTGILLKLLIFRKRKTSKQNNCNNTKQRIFNIL